MLGSVLGSGNMIDSVGKALDNLFTSDEERMELDRELLKAKKNFDLQEAKLVAEQNKSQMEVNMQEAKSSNFFIAGWRPAIGWIGALALAYQFLIYPVLLWYATENPPPQMQPDMLYTIITGMLGVAGMRSFDKLKKTDTRAINKGNQ